MGFRVFSLLGAELCIETGTLCQSHSISYEIAHATYHIMSYYADHITAYHIISSIRHQNPPELTLQDYSNPSIVGRIVVVTGFLLMATFPRVVTWSLNTVSYLLWSPHGTMLATLRAVWAMRVYH